MIKKNYLRWDNYRQLVLKDNGEYIFALTIGTFLVHGLKISIYFLVF